MRIGLAQMDIHWENIGENMKAARRFFAQAAEKDVDILVFPEMTLTGFSMNVKETGEKWKDQVDFFKKMSRDYGILAIFGYAMPVPEEEREAHPDWKSTHNRLGICEDGQLKKTYAKIHPFSFGLEGDYYQGGDELVFFPWKDTVISAFICYDLRFPEPFLICSEESEIIFVISNWPGSRVDQMDALLRARAIENQAFVIGVNRTGEGDGLIYTGHSAAYDPAGQVQNEICEDERLIIVDLDPSIIAQTRGQFPLKKDRRPDLYYELWKKYRKK